MGGGKVFLLDTILGIFPIFACLWLGGLICLLLATWFIAYYKVGALISWILVMWNIIVFAICLIYYWYKPKSCKVQVYTRISLILSIIAAFYFDPVGAHYSFVGIPTVILGAIYHFLMWVLLGTSHDIWTAIKWCGHIIVAAFIVGIWWLLSIAIMGIVGYLMHHFTPKFTSGKTGNKKPVISEEELAAKVQIMRNRNILSNAISCNSSYSGDFWRNFVNSKEINEYLKGLNKILTDYDEIPKDIYEKARLYKDKRMAEYEKKRVAQARRDELCQKITDKISIAFIPVVAVSKQLRIFSSMLWQTIKAKGSGACPFLYFEDTKK